MFYLICENNFLLLLPCWDPMSEYQGFPVQEAHQLSGMMMAMLSLMSDG
jgi:hypothetical protein